MQFLALIPWPNFQHSRRALPMTQSAKSTAPTQRCHRWLRHLIELQKYEVSTLKASAQTPEGLVTQSGLLLMWICCMRLQPALPDGKLAASEVQTRTVDSLFATLPCNAPGRI